MAEPYQIWVNKFYQRKTAFTSTEDGIVPASGGGTTAFLRADGTWAIPSGGGGGSLSDGDYGDIVVSSSAAVFTVDAGVISNTKLATVATQTFKGRTTAGTGAPEDLTVTQATALLNTFTSALKGLVPPSGGGTANFLRADGTFAAPPTGSTVAMTYGTADLNFGAAPGTNVITLTVTGQTGIVSGSNVRAWIMAEASASHNAYEHMLVPLRLTCGNIVAGTGFDIVAVSDMRLTGIFKCRWAGDY